MPAKQAYMPLLRSFASFFPWFYRHAAPTALWLGYRGSRVFQQAANSILRDWEDFFEASRQGSPMATSLVAA